MMLGVFP